MPFQPPTLDQIDARTQADIVTRLPGAAPQLRRSIVTAIGRALTGAVYALYGYMAKLFAQAVPATATGSNLDRWASLWGETRQQPAPSSGPISLAGTSGADVPSGSTLQYADGSTFATTADVAIGGGGTATAMVRATASGSTSNLPAGATLTFVSPLTGVNATATVGTGGLTGGLDLGTDDQLLAALENRIQNPPQGGSKNDYVTWAKSNSQTGAGITRAWCFPLYNGPGTVRVYVVDDTYAGPGLASAGEVTAVQTYIDSVRPVTVASIVGGVQVSGVQVIAPTAQPVNFTIGGVAAGQRAAVQAALAALFLREAVPEGSMARQDMVLVIGNTLGSGAFTLTTPAADQVAAAGNILTLGTFTWV